MSTSFDQKPWFAVAKIEREIDEIVYRLFDLTTAEIAHIETALANTRAQLVDDGDDAGCE